MTTKIVEALRELLRHTSNIEVLGEWSALEMNFTPAKKLRAQVDAVIADARVALAEHDAQPAQCQTEDDCTQQPWCKIRGACQKAPIAQSAAEPVAWIDGSGRLQKNLGDMPGANWRPLYLKT
jgi:hypothetical protein